MTRKIQAMSNDPSRSEAGDSQVTPALQMTELLAAIELIRWLMKPITLVRMLWRTPARRARKIHSVAGDLNAPIELASWLARGYDKPTALRSLLFRSILAPRDAIIVKLLRSWTKSPTVLEEAYRTRKRSHNRLFTGVWDAFTRAPIFNHAPVNPSKENILLVTHEASRTGAPILAWNIGKVLARRYNVFIVSLRPGALLPEFDALSAVAYKSYSKSEPRLQSLLGGRKFKYAIINSAESRQMLEMCSMYRIPTIFLIHEFASLVYPLQSLRAALSISGEIVFPANIVARSVEDIFPEIRGRKMHVLPQGRCALPGATGGVVSHAATLQKITYAKAHESTFVVVGAGSVSIRKGVDLFIATASAVKRANPPRPVHFVWVGHSYEPARDMSYSVYLKEQIERAGLQDNITFLGAVDDLEPTYSLADAFFLSSRLDPLPNVAIDAASLGIPIICFKEASGIAEILLSNDETAMGVVEHQDVHGAASVIRKLAADASVHARVSAATRRLAELTFRMEDYVTRLDQIGTLCSGKTE